MSKKAAFPLILLLFTAIFLIWNLKTFLKMDNKHATLAIGMAAPELKLIDIRKNSPLSLASLKGKVVFINFWASWCQPCISEMPSISNLNRVMSKYEDFQMVTVIFNEDPKISLSFLEKSGFNIPVYIDPGGAAAASFGLTGVPETYIIDKKGIITEIKLGPEKWDSNKVINFISKLRK